jgi:hypothetical protein
MSLPRTGLRLYHKVCRIFHQRHPVQYLRLHLNKRPFGDRQTPRVERLHFRRYLPLLVTLKWTRKTRTMIRTNTLVHPQSEHLQLPEPCRRLRKVNHLLRRTDHHHLCLHRCLLLHSIRLPSPQRMMTYTLHRRLGSLTTGLRLHHLLIRMRLRLYHNRMHHLRRLKSEPCPHLHLKNERFLSCHLPNHSRESIPIDYR